MDLSEFHLAPPLLAQPRGTRRDLPAARCEPADAPSLAYRPPASRLAACGAARAEGKGPLLPRLQPARAARHLGFMIINGCRCRAAVYSGGPADAGTWASRPRQAGQAVTVAYPTFSTHHPSWVTMPVTRPRHLSLAKGETGGTYTGRRATRAMVPTPSGRKSQRWIRRVPSPSHGRTPRAR